MNDLRADYFSVVEGVAGLEAVSGLDAGVDSVLAAPSVAATFAEESPSDLELSFFEAGFAPDLA